MHASRDNVSRGIYIYIYIDIDTFSLCFSVLLILHYIQPFVVPFVVKD